eukprot:TRINITY_DN4883_c0_g2_i1.p1 TRINITY_DN4883_c0_g2~~TRINITY_DN4883_c0_g2_i1.p1  ORF type:complete len:470 (-),score=66.16 TRINITY_DN4883_c0_g2_i1:107-1516(-)
MFPFQQSLYTQQPQASQPNLTFNQHPQLAAAQQAFNVVSPFVYIPPPQFAATSPFSAAPASDMPQSAGPNSAHFFGSASGSGFEPRRHQFAIPSFVRPAAVSVPTFRSSMIHGTAMEAESAAVIQDTNVISGRRMFTSPFRDDRPLKLALILRGLPGSGKTLMAHQICELERTAGAEQPRVLTFDDYFHVRHTGPFGGHESIFRYDPHSADMHRTNFASVFENALQYHNCVLVDAVNSRLAHFTPLCDIAHRYGFSCYVIEMPAPQRSAVSMMMQHNRGGGGGGYSPEQLDSFGREWEMLPPELLTIDMSDIVQTNTDEQLTDMNVEHNATVRLASAELDHPTSGTSELEPQSPPPEMPPSPIVKPSPESPPFAMIPTPTNAMFPLRRRRKVRWADTEPGSPVVIRSKRKAEDSVDDCSDDVMIKRSATRDNVRLMHSEFQRKVKEEQSQFRELLAQARNVEDMDDDNS